MSTLPLDALAAGLQATAQGPDGEEAAARLVVAHDHWLRRADFVDCLVLTDRERFRPPVVRIWWQAVPQFAATAECATSERRILRLAASLAGYCCDSRTGGCEPLGDLLSGLDDRNAQLVLDALAHVLSRGGRR